MKWRNLQWGGIYSVKPERWFLFNMLILEIILLPQTAAGEAHDWTAWRLGCTFSFIHAIEEHKDLHNFSESPLHVDVPSLSLRISHSSALLTVILESEDSGAAHEITNSKLNSAGVGHIWSLLRESDFPTFQTICTESGVFFVGAYTRGSTFSVVNTITRKQRSRLINTRLQCLISVATRSSK